MLGYMLLFNGFCITLLAYLTIWGVTNETLAKWSELDGVLQHIGMHVNPEIADAFGLKILAARRGRDRGRACCIGRGVEKAVAS